MQRSVGCDKLHRPLWREFLVVAKERPLLDDLGSVLKIDTFFHIVGRGRFRLHRQLTVLEIDLLVGLGGHGVDWLLL